LRSAASFGALTVDSDAEAVHAILDDEKVIEAKKPVDYSCDWL
jgi:hypothetical protein